MISFNLETIFYNIKYVTQRRIIVLLEIEAMNTRIHEWGTQCARLFEQSHTSTLAVGGALIECT